MSSEDSSKKMNRTQAKRGLVYLVATVIAILIGVGHNLSGSELLPLAGGFTSEYLTAANEAGVVFWVLAIFVLTIGAGVAFYLIGYGLLYTSSALVWAGNRLLSHRSTEGDKHE